MYNGVGVRTTRGTGTSGHVQKNIAQAPTKRFDTRKTDEEKFKPSKSRTISSDLQEHERKRKIEVELILWAEDHGYTLEDGYCYINFFLHKLYFLQFFSKTQEEIDQAIQEQREILETRSSR